VRLPAWQHRPFTRGGVRGSILGAGAGRCGARLSSGGLGLPAYATAKLSFANAIVIAQCAGETDEEIAHVTGYTVPMFRAVLRSS